MKRTLDHAPSTHSSTRRLTAIKQAVGTVAKRKSAAHTVAGVLLGDGRRNGPTSWAAPRGEDAAYGLHAVEEADAGSSGAGRSSAVRVSGIAGARHDRAGRVRGGVGIGPRP